VRYYRRALELAPHNEPIAGRLIWLLTNMGNRAEAWEEYLAFADRLESDLGIEPCSSTKRLVRDVLGVDPHLRRPARTDFPSIHPSP
jgi:DNA-binding SARP family transcriptional activator